MVDTQKGKVIRILDSGRAGSFLGLMFPLDLLGQVRELLDRNEISYWVHTNVISIGDSPEFVFVNLESKVDAVHLRALLDDIS